MINSYLDDGYSYDEAYARSVQIVAVPGTSEHHLGLALDIVDSSYTKLNHQQAKMPTQKWLMEHCWEYGFILRYPADKSDSTGIIYEPWHYRYVGVDVARELQESGLTLEEYIANLH
jgi:D-alanyl-D-alanine carboxypeptidase